MPISRVMLEGYVLLVNLGISINHKTCNTNHKSYFNRFDHCELLHPSNSPVPADDGKKSVIKHWSGKMNGPVKVNGPAHWECERTLEYKLGSI